MSNYPSNPNVGGYPVNPSTYPVNPAAYPNYPPATVQPVQNYQINVMAYPSNTGYQNPGSK